MTERARKRQQAAKAKADAQSSTPLPQQPPQQLPPPQKYRRWVLFLAVLISVKVIFSHFWLADLFRSAELV